MYTVTCRKAIQAHNKLHDLTGAVVFDMTRVLALISPNDPIRRSEAVAEKKKAIPPPGILGMMNVLLNVSSFFYRVHDSEINLGAL